MNRRSLLISILVGAALLLPGIFIYWPFIAGNAVLLYRDIGNDSLTSYYADFVHLSQYIRNDGFPSWSFHIGMGQDMAYATGFLFWEPVTWLPARFIAQALVYQHLLKVVVAGLLFFWFLHLRRLPPGVAFFGALLLGYSGYMTMGSCWYLPAEELLAFTALLLAAERAVRTGRWLWLALVLTPLGFINPFYLYLGALLLACYVPIRLIEQNGWQPGVVLARSLKLAAAAFLGVLLGAIVTLPFLHVVLNSPRGAGVTNSLAALSSLSVFRLESASHYATAVLRFFTNDLLGTGDAFRGWQNYLEAPLTYCGLVCLVLLPQVFVKASRRQRLTGLLFVLALIIPTVLPWFRYLFWLFKGDYYRTYSLFCVLGMITLAMTALTRYLEDRILNLWLLGGTLAVVLAIFYLPIGPIQAVIDPKLRLIVTCYLVFDAAVLGIGHITKRQYLAAYLILAATAVELGHFERITVAQRTVVLKQDLHHGMAVDPTLADAIADLKRDDASLFRVTELHLAAGAIQTEPNNPMTLGYYGTSSYGSFNDLNYIRFLAAIGALTGRSEFDTRWAVGLTGNFIFSLFGGEKYVLTQEPQPFQRASQYEFVRDYGDYRLFRNAFSLPIGLSYSRYLPEKDFAQLLQGQMEQVLLATAVLDDEQLKLAPGLTATTLSELETELGASSYPAMVEKRRATALQLDVFEQSRLTGKIRLDQPSVVVLQMPFSKGWRVLQDGQPVAALKVDVGLLGIAVPAGEHVLELRYRNPWLIPGAVISLAALLILLFARWRWPRLATRAA